MSGCSRRHSYDCTLPSFLPLSSPCVLETPGILCSPSLHSTSAAREADCVSQGIGSRGQRHLHCYLFQSAVCVSLFARQLLASRVSRLHEKETHLRCSCLLALFACFGRSSAAAACVSLCFMLWIPFSSFLSSSLPLFRWFFHALQPQSWVTGMQQQPPSLLLFSRIHSLASEGSSSSRSRRLLARRTQRLTQGKKRKISQEQPVTLTRSLALSIPLSR